MASKPREYNIPTHPNRDFWLSLWPTSNSPPAKGATAEPTPTYSVPKGSRRTKMPTISEEPSKAKKPKPARTKSKSKKASTSKGPGSWSEWYISEDNKYFWRARKLPNDEWDYQTQPKPEPQPEIQPLPHPHMQPISQQKPKPEPEPQPLPHPHMEPISQPNSPKITIEDTTPSPSPSPSSPSPSSSPERSTTSKDNHLLKPPISPALKSHRSGSNPKSSYPTIITTSTGRPTEAITASPRTSGLTLTRIESISPVRKPTPAGVKTTQPTSKPAPKVINPPTTTTTNNKKSSSPKRPIGPVMWLLTEGARSKKGKSLASPPPAPKKATLEKTEKQQSGGGGGSGGGGQVHLQPGGVVITKTRGSGGVSNSELAKKKKLLDKKIKEGKVMDTKVDSKKRIRAWLGGVEGEEELIPLDGEGFPVYR
ncbi:hypothetical protein B0T21DRAFT_449705 [Apiosordaria backusii]|uniref:Uncharacterized protein n=1 Tax=Apiosordaria backusii TaxID=314023 RepID=A0AA40EI76_9PEZI|nr:hypothetical protein B0T21DRAFT_449705 [Apiosordaria backusii]